MGVWFNELSFLVHIFNPPNSGIFADGSAVNETEII